MDAQRDRLYQRLTDPDNDGLWMRERLIPRTLDGRSSRPIAPPPHAPAPRPGAVLVLLYPHDDTVFLPLTVRTTSLRDHSGEVSLPGGSFEPDDGDLRRTALREAWEELAIPPEAVMLWTQLTPIWIPVSNFQITPFIGWSDQRPSFTAAEAEVAELLEVPLTDLLHPDAIQSDVRELHGITMRIPYFAVGGQKVWGATAMVLSEVVGKLRAEAAKAQG